MSLFVRFGLELLLPLLETCVRELRSKANIRDYILEIRKISSERAQSHVQSKACLSVF